MARKKPETTNENGGRLYAERKEPAEKKKRRTLLGRQERS